MNAKIPRREFLAGAGAGATAFASGMATQIAQAKPRHSHKAEIKKGMVYGMLNDLLKKGTIEDAFKTARDCGFDGVEAYTTAEPKQVEALKAASDKTGFKIHSIMNQAHWQFPLSSDDADTVKKSLDGMVTSLHNAHDLGAETVLLVPAVVNPKTRYIDAYRRSQRRIRELLPQAEELGVTIALEEVWNKFLLSPIEFARYVDEFNTPHLAAYFDVGNVVLYGYPQDWIRTLGDRIKKVHIKDFKVEGSGWKWTNLYDGAVDWREVRKAFDEIGYTGWFTAELGGGDADYLSDVAKRMDRIIAGE
jgi:hexulose-6-phosphate isomerase